jgi:flagellar biosynthetic protein FlhB
MADEEKDDSQKTEEPTQKRLDQAREDGRVVATREVASFLLLGMAALLCGGGLAVAASRLAHELKPWLAGAHLGTREPAALAGPLIDVLLESGLVLALPLGAAMVLAALASLAQHGPIWSPKAAAPQASRVSPMAGLRRLFSSSSLAELARGLIKLIGVGAIAYVVGTDEAMAILGSVELDARGLLALIGHLATRLLTAIAAFTAVLAVLDYVWQRHSFMRQMRMTRQEVLDEHKHNEGDPIIKQRLRSLRLARARRRMMADVPKATVVITNPTHFAVALRYDPAEAPAPVVVAKGADRVAAKIREIAAANSVPLIENPPLARLLHASVEIGQPIPPAHYRAVAEIIGYILRLRQPVA